MSSKIEYSDFQKTIFSEIAHGTDNLVIEALAGSGKTTSLIESLKYVPKGNKVLLVAFGKSIADELKERAPLYMSNTISTFHALGLAGCRNAFGKITINPNKTFKIIQKLLAKDKKNAKQKDNFEAIFALKRTVSLCKSYIIDTPTKIDELLDNFGIDTAGYDRDDFIRKVIFVISEGKKQKKILDFDEMIFFPFCFNLKIGEFDYVIIDEYQDMNIAQMYIVLSACKKGGRIIAAGDFNQAIFLFRGADAATVDIKNRIKGKTLPLPISYRCAKRIIYEAQTYVPAIKSAPNAIDGSVKTIKEDVLIDLIKPGDFLLSRTNAPLVKWCMRFIRAKIPANIQNKDKDIGTTLSSMIKQSNKKTVKSFLEWLEDWKKSESKRLREKNRDTTIVNDKYECLINLCEDAENLEQVKGNIKQLFDDKDDRDKIVCGTVHSVKGMERDNVFILQSSFRMYSTEQEERNIKYVAITRAKSKLYYVEK